MTKHYNEMQIDALQEVMNTGAGHAAADLSEMVDRSMDIDVPRVLVTDLMQAIEVLGDPMDEVTAVCVQVSGEMEAVLAVVVNEAEATTLCTLLGADFPSDYGYSALGEIGNTLACSYVNALAEMAELKLEVHPPAVSTDMLAALMSTVAAEMTMDVDGVLLIDSELAIAGENCTLSLLLMPESHGIQELLSRLGL